LKDSTRKLLPPPRWTVGRATGLELGFESDWNAAFVVVVMTLRNEGIENAIHVAEEVIEALAEARLKPVRQSADEG